MKFKKGDTVIYPQHGACIVKGTEKMEAFGAVQDYLILKTVINEMTLRVPVAKAQEVGVRPPVNADELEDLVAVLSKPDPRVPSNWSRRFKNHQEKLKSGDVYQVAEVVRNLAARNRDASLSAAEPLSLRQAFALGRPLQVHVFLLIAMAVAISILAAIGMERALTLVPTRPWHGAALAAAGRIVDCLMLAWVGHVLAAWFRDTTGWRAPEPDDHPFRNIRTARRTRG